uniref:Uncharacterized protein n=1 Tax=Podoviridae sp. ctsUe5 TaxID=2827750 RepID=A0A8S5S628_9CAUD|nr:MAG TPA: hypothetical protein [Podoviridae sp. ctsUe5]
MSTPAVWTARTQMRTDIVTVVSKHHRHTTHASGSGHCPRHLHCNTRARIRNTRIPIIIYVHTSTYIVIQPI